MLNWELDITKDFVVPQDEYLHYVSDATKYRLLLDAIKRWESHEDWNTLDEDALRYEHILDMVDRWEHNKTGPFKRREGREDV